LQLGFVIDHSRCIGCHACTVACKSENDVPLGKFRTWVKYTERGHFPEVRRSFAVLRCNQCTDAPCVTICPVGALDKRPDGIVDVDPQRCIGCKSCMQGCPYDALYLNDDKGTVEKCHFCAHRAEIGLAPACAVVCPTEAIVPGDFDDPGSRVSRMKTEDDLKARKTEAGTGPNVFYKDVAEAGVAPLQTNAAGGFLWADRLPGAQLDAQIFEALERRAEARTTYDVQHPTVWGWKISAYLFTKSLAAGTALAGLALLDPLGVGFRPDRPALISILALALFFLTVTGILLVLDLKRPERFLYILRYPNWRSWLVRGTWILIGFGGLLSLQIFLVVNAIEIVPAVETLLLALTTIAAVSSAVYTAWLFAQSKARVLWLGRGMAVALAAHALAAGAGLLVLTARPVGIGAEALEVLRVLLVLGLAVHLLVGFAEKSLAPRRREEEYHRALRLVTHGPFARRHWWVGVAAGGALPVALLLVPDAPELWAIGAAASLVGLFVEQDTLVRAGQALAIS